MNTLRTWPPQPHGSAEIALGHALPLIPGASVGLATFAMGGEGDLSGDFCTSVLAGERWLIAVGDMEGKGRAASSSVDECRRLLHDTAESGVRPHELVAMLNDVLAGTGRPEDSRPCAVCVVSLRPCEGGFAGRVCNGGSPLPLVARANGELDALGGPNLAAGYFPKPTWNDWAFELSPGDTLIILTDGLVDSRSPQGFFGDERLDLAAQKLAAQHVGDGAAIAAGLVAEAQRFALPHLPQDDMLVLAVSVPHRT